MRKKFSISDRFKSFVYAWKGISYSILTQHNFLIHIGFTITAILLGFLLKISEIEWIVIIIVIGMVMSLEILNTAIEELVNLVSPERNKTAGIVKDLAAGAVLISAIAAFIVGAIIFLPKIFELL